MLLRVARPPPGTQRMGLSLHQTREKLRHSANKGCVHTVKLSQKVLLPLQRPNDLALLKGTIHTHLRPMAWLQPLGWYSVLSQVVGVPFLLPRRCLQYSGSSGLLHPTFRGCMMLPGGWSSFGVCCTPKKMMFPDSPDPGQGHFHTIITSPPSPSTPAACPGVWYETALGHTAQGVLLA